MNYSDILPFDNKNVTVTFNNGKMLTGILTVVVSSERFVISTSPWFWLPSEIKAIVANTVE